MIRYSRILEKNPKEIVFLKSPPSTWERYFFVIIFMLINLAYVFDFPKKYLQSINDIVYEKEIGKYEY